MSSTVRVIAGTDPDVLTEQVLREYAAALRAGRDCGLADVGLWLTPTKRSQREVTRRLIGRLGQACWMPRIVTFDGFAEWLLRRAGRPATQISSTVRRLLLRRIAQELLASDQLVHFAPVAHTSGLLDVVESFIAELKRDEIWPERFLQVCGDDGPDSQSSRLAPRDESASEKQNQHVRQRKRNLSRSERATLPVAQRDRELAQIYQRYQDVLNDNRWYDAEGRFWLARSELAAGRCDPLPPWTYIAAVGFADFTRTQHEILEHLARRTRQLVITLPWDETRPDVFDTSAATWERLCKSFGTLKREPPETTGTEAEFRRVIREGLFSNPRQWKPAGAATGLEIVAATGQRSERAAVARRIKSLLADGVPAGSIVVGLRSLSVDGLEWTKSLNAAGVPAWCEIGPPLKEQGLVKFLVAVLCAERDDWAFSRLMTVLDSSFFRPHCSRESKAESREPEKTGAAVRAASTALRRLQLPERRTVILDVLQGAAARVSEPETAESNEMSLHALAKQALPLLRWYSSQTEPLRRGHTLVEWIDVLAELVKHCGAIDSTNAEDVSLWDRLQRTLRDAADAEARSCAAPAPLKLSEFIEEFRDLIASEQMEAAEEHPGCVRVLSFDQLRHVSCPHVFLAGLTEDCFPQRRSDDCLFTDAERERLWKRGLSLRFQARHQLEEMQFFHSLLLRASRTLTISYPEIDQNGQPVFASPYVASLRRLFADDALPVQQEGQLDPVPPADQALSQEDVRLVAIEEALAGRCGWLRALQAEPPTRSMVDNLLAAVEMAAHRFHTSGFTAYEGRLERPDHQNALAARFGPQHQFSATELEAYASCPFRFWLENVLEIEPPADPAEGTDHLGRGHIVHAALAELLSPMVAGAAPAELAARFHELVHERLDRQPTNTELQRALTRIEHQLLNEWAAAYATQVEKYSEQIRSSDTGPWSAAHAELAFGDAHGESGDPARPTYPPLEIGPPDHRVRVCGRIDRVDLGTANGRSVFTVIDYKTGRRPKFTKEKVESGEALQLVLYTLAVQRLGISPVDAVPFQLGYWCLREAGFDAELTRSRKPTPLDAAVWQSLVQMVEETVPRLAAGIRTGEFVVASQDKDCTSFCSYRTVCRVSQVRPVAEKLVKVRRH